MRHAPCSIGAGPCGAEKEAFAMKRWVGAAAVVGLVALLAGVAFAQMGWGYGPGVMVLAWAGGRWAPA